jgi:AcrR family transcriptional regulator
VKSRDRKAAWQATRNLRRDERRDAILKAATNSLNELGYSGASMAEIARRLGLSYNALYHYFDGKDDILYHCFVRSTNLLSQRIEAARLAEGSGLARLLSFVDEFLSLLEQEPMPAPHLILHLPEARLRVFVKQNTGYIAMLQALIEQGIADGSIAPCDTRIAVSYTLGSLINFPYYKYDGIEAIHPGIRQFFQRLHGIR